MVVIAVEPVDLEVALCSAMRLGKFDVRLLCLFGATLGAPTHMGFEEVEVEEGGPERRIRQDGTEVDRVGTIGKSAKGRFGHIWVLFTLWPLSVGLITQ